LDIGHCYTPSFKPGDRVQQVAQVGLGMLNEPVYVLKSWKNGEMTVSPEANGQPLTDLGGQPRHFPSGKFRKVT